MKKSNHFAALTACLLLLSLLLSACAPSALRSTQEEPLEKAGPLMTGKAFQKAAENERFLLEVHPRKGWLRISEKGARTLTQAPEGYEKDETARGSVKRTMESLVEIRYADQVFNISTENAAVGAAAKGGISCRKLKDGARFALSFQKSGISLWVDVRLQEEGLSVSIPVSSIREEKPGFLLTSVSILPYFGAARSGQEGYLLVPDGCGALISLQREGKPADDFDLPVYGREPAVLKIKKPAEERLARLPVFGIKECDHALFCHLSEGAPRAVICTSPAGKKSQYYGIYSRFIYRDSEMMTVEKTGQSVRVVETEPAKTGRYTVEYRFLNGADANYTGMAKAARKLLLGDRKPAPSAASMTLKAFGGLYLEDQKAPIPMKRVLPLTTYGQLEELLCSLQKAGVEQLDVTYLYALSGGDRGAVPKHISPEHRLGGKKDLLHLAETAQSKNIRLDLDVDLVRVFKRSGSGGSLGVTAIQGSPAAQYFYWASTHQARLTEPYFLLERGRQKQAADRLCKDWADWPFAGVSCESLSTLLYSDFRKNGVTRAEAEICTKERLSDLKQAAGRLVCPDANAYAFSTADKITDVPLCSSRHFAVDQEVPFYQMVCHGRIPMTAPPLNQLADEQEGFLRAMESGVGLQYAVIAGNSAEAAGHLDNPVCSALFSDWEETIKARYAESSAFLQQVSGAEISGHQIKGDLHLTEFSNGVSIAVNYGTEEETLADKTVVLPGSYHIFEREKEA